MHSILQIIKIYLHLKIKKMEKTASISFRLSENLKKKAEELSKNRYGDVNISQLMNDLISESEIETETIQLKAVERALGYVLDSEKEKEKNSYGYRVLVQAKKDFEAIKKSTLYYKDLISGIEAKYNEAAKELIEIVNNIRFLDR